MRKKEKDDALDALESLRKRFFFFLLFLYVRQTSYVSCLAEEGSTVVTYGSIVY